MLGETLARALPRWQTGEVVGLQPSGPAPGLPEAVRRHAPALRRTALMLTGQEAAADRLVVEVLRSAPASADRAQLVQLLTRAYLHRAPSWRRPELEAVAGLTDPDAGDVLASLRPRARAATVLRRAEGWPASRVADALHVDRTVVARMVPRSSGLEAALAALADRHSRPADEVVTTVLTELTSPSPGPGPDPLRDGGTPAAGPPAPLARARTEAARLAHRPWTWRVLAGAVALGLVVWASALGDPVPDLPAADADAGGRRLALVDGTSLPTAGGDLAERGWALGPDGAPPVDLEGLRLLQVVPVNLAQATAPLRVDTRPRSGEAVFAALWCDLPVDDPRLHPPAARLMTGGESAVLACAGTGGEPAVERLVPLPPGTGRGLSTVLVAWSGDVPTRGRALLATYTEVGAGPTPVDVARPARPVVGAGTLVLDGTSPAYQVQSRTVHHRRVRVGPDTTLTVWAGAAGGITVQVDDTVVTDDGEAAVVPLDGACEHEDSGGDGIPDGAAPQDPPPPDAWRTADPELRDGRWLVYRPGRARELLLPDRLRPAAGQSRVATVTVSTTLAARSWQVQVSGASLVQEDTLPLPVTDAPPDRDVPEWVGGHRLATAWQVPNDGVPHALADPGLRPGRRFILVGSPARPAPEGWGAVAPHVATTRGAAELSMVRSVPDAFDEGVWRPGEQLLRAGASTRNIRAGTGTGVVAVTVPAAPGPTPPSTLLAYEPVAHEDFDFAAAPPMGVFAAPGEPLPDPLAAAGGSTVVVGRWTAEDLDDEGRLRIEEDLSSRTWLRLSTEGRGRVRVLEGGRPAVWLPDGWWSSWTAAPVVTDLRVEGTRTAGVPGQPFELVVEGYEEGFAVEVRVRGGEDGAPGST